MTRQGGRAVSVRFLSGLAVLLTASMACAEPTAAPSIADRAGVARDPLDPAWIRAAVKRVADWQLEHLRGETVGWQNAVFYSGLMAAHRITDEHRYLAALVEVGERSEWRIGDRYRHADDHAVAQTFLDLYRREPDARRLAAFRAAVDRMIAEPPAWSKPHQQVDYWWCDALFMSPPALAKLAAVTGEASYLDLMDRLWGEAHELLYDRETRLYHRDLRSRARREPFWGRGNGWVLAGLARVLEELPAARPSRAFYEDAFRDLAERIVELQGEDGLWRSDLEAPDAAAPGESSASALFVFGIAWGVEHRVLSRERFVPAVLSGWTALARNLDADGRLGWVQKPAAGPGRARRRHAEAFGSGAYLLAAEPVLALAESD